MGLEMGETSNCDVSVLEDDSLNRSKELCLVEPYLKEAPFEEFCDEIVMGSDPHSSGNTYPICTCCTSFGPHSSPYFIPFSHCFYV